MRPTRPTGIYLALEARLGQPLDDLVTAWRATRAPWREIARRLRKRTGIDVSHETVRSWFREDAA